MSYASGLGKSDHAALLLQLACFISQPESCPTKLNIHRAGFKKMKKMFEIDWQQLMTDEVEDANKCLKGTLNGIIDKCFPVAKSKRARKNITSSVLQFQKQKNAF